MSARSLAERFPSVMRILTGAAPDEDQRNDEDEGPQDPPVDPPADEPADPPADPPADEPDGAEGDDTAAAISGQGALAVSNVGITAENRVALLQAFENDANQLVTAERTRCISVFTSDAGRRNPAGAAACLEEGLSTERSVALLGTVSSRTIARDRLSGDASTRVQTGSGREGADNAGTDARAKHKARQEKRNKSVKGGKKPNETDVDAE